MKQNVFFVSGIDTDAGKSYATGFLARELNKNGKRTITQKFIQTGNVGYSKILTCTAVSWEFLTPKKIVKDSLCRRFSPIRLHRILASQLDKRPINFNKMEQATAELSHRYDIVLLEGAGGLMVPLTEELLTIDYVAQKGYPLIFVTSGKLGSINHTLLSFEAIRNRGIRLDTVMYNLYPTVEDKTIQEDTQSFIRKYMEKYFPDTRFILVPEIKLRK